MLEQTNRPWLWSLNTCEAPQKMQGSSARPTMASTGILPAARMTFASRASLPRVAGTRTWLFLLDSGHDGLRSLRGYRVGWCCMVFDSDITQYDTIWHVGAVWFRILKVLCVFGPFGPSSWLAEPPCLNDSSAGFEGMNHRKGGEDMTRTEKPAEVSELNGNENWIRGFHNFSPRNCRANQNSATQLCWVMQWCLLLGLIRWFRKIQVPHPRTNI